MDKNEQGLPENGLLSEAWRLCAIGGQEISACMDIDHPFRKLETAIPGNLQAIDDWHT